MKKSLQALNWLIVLMLVFSIGLGCGISGVSAAENANSFVSAGQMVGNAPISIKTTLRFGETWGDELEQIWLAGLGTEPHAPPTILALEWVQGVWSWFPSWRLQLSSSVGMSFVAADGNDITQAAGGAITLNTARPVQGHVYESLLSYDAARGLVSVAVTDKTDGKLIYNGAFHTDKTDQQLVEQSVVSYPVAGIRVAAGEAAALTGETAAAAATVDGAAVALPQFGPIETARAFIPVWTEWEIGARNTQTGKYEPAYFVERDSDLAVRITTAGSDAAGAFHVVPGFNGITEKSLPIQANSEWTPLDTGRLPLGTVNMTLQYLVGDAVWLAETRELSVGSFAILVNPISVDTEHQTLHGMAQITSTSDLSGLELSVQAALRRVTWNQAERRYLEGPVEESTFQTINFTSGLATRPDTDRPYVGNKTEIPFTMPLPTEPGLWKLVVYPDASVPVRSEVTGGDQLFSTYAPAHLEPGQPFTIAVLPDTQNYTTGNSDIFTRQAQWIAENARSHNIALMLHMGDVTQDNTPEQWEKAQRSLGLLDSTVPYVLAVGNHDMARSGGVRARGETLISNYFPASRFPALGGTFAPGRMENSYHTFNFAGVDFMVVSLEFGPPDDVLAWANEVVESHPDHRVIVITHTYVNKEGSRGGDPKRYGLARNPQTTVNDGNDMWRKFVAKHQNILMVMSGHIGVPTIPFNISFGEKGNRVYSFLLDYQGEPQGGNGWMALFTFQPNNTIEVRAYSPYLDAEKSSVDAKGFNNHFTIDLATGAVTQ